MQKVKIVDYKVLEVIPFNDYDPPADLHHMSRFKTAWLVEIDNILYGFYFIKEECWLGDFVESSGIEVSLFDQPNRNENWFENEKYTVLSSHLPANEWMGITDDTESYSIWIDGSNDLTETDEEKSFQKQLYDKFVEIYNHNSPGYSATSLSHLDDTEFEIGTDQPDNNIKKANKIDLKDTIAEINSHWEMRFEMYGEDLKEELYSKITDNNKISFEASFYQIEANKFGFQVDIGLAWDSTLSLEQLQEAGKEEFDNEDYYLESVVNAYVAKIADFSENVEDTDYNADITKAVLEGGGPLSYCEQRLLFLGEEVWKIEA